MNAVLITADSLRRDFLMTREGEIIGTVAPNLKRLSLDAAIFPNAVSQAPYTRASFSSLFTSRYPSVALTSSGRLAGELPALAELLQKAGYRTCGIHSNPFLSPPFGFHRGFEHFQDNLISSKSRFVPEKMRILTTKVLGVLKKRAYLDADGINAQVESWVRSLAKDDRFFLWIHYMDTHGPYYIESESTVFQRYRAELLWRKAKRNPESVSEAELESLRDQYRMKISWLDGKLERIFRLLDGLGLSESTLIIFTSDHGDAFREHGTITHTRQLYEELINVPLILWDPKRATGNVELAPIGLLDVTPTILDTLGVNSEELGFEGMRLRKLIEGKAEGARAILSEATPDRAFQVVSVRSDRWKCIANRDRRELYDLKADPMESMNVAEAHPEVVKSMEGILEDHIRTHQTDRVEETEVDVGEETKRRLKALGYYD
jgi:arylsulfatase